MTSRRNKDQVIESNSQAVARINGEAEGEDTSQPMYLPTLSDEVGAGNGIRPAQIKIMQPSTPEVAAGEYTGGVWASSLVGELGSEIVIVPLLHGQFRIMNNPDKEFGENEIVCASPDSVTGYVNPESDWPQKDALGGACASCPMQKFTHDASTGRRRPPLCTHNRTFASYFPEHDLIGQTTFRKTSAPAGEDILSTVQQSRAFGHDAFRVGLRFTRRGSYSYYVPMVRRMAIQEEWMDAIRDSNELLKGGLASQMTKDAYQEASADLGATFDATSGFATR